jgi:hypothetical protein
MLTRKFRMPAFAVVTLVGAVHVRSASASPSGLFDACDTFAASYAAYYCSANSMSVCGLSYTCIGRNAAPIEVSVDCCSTD